jgi:hypothetical protein
MNSGIKDIRAGLPRNHSSATVSPQRS